MSLEKSFTEEKQPLHLRSISRRRQAGLARRSGSGGAGWGYLFARRVSRAASPPGVQQTSRPPRRGSVGGGGGGAGQSCLRSAALQFPNLPGEGSGEQGRAAGCARRRFQKPLRSRSLFAGRDGASPGGGHAGKSRHKCTAASPPRPHASPGKVSPSGEAPWLSVAPGGCIQIYIVGWGGGCCLWVFLNYFFKKYFFSPCFPSLCLVFPLPAVLVLTAVKD